MMPSTLIARGTLRLAARGPVGLFVLEPENLQSLLAPPARSGKPP